MNDIITRIKKLLALSTSPNEHEAAAAASKAQELLMEHNIDLDSIRETRTQAEIAIDTEALEMTMKRVFWKGQLANAIAKGNFCKFWWSKGQMQLTGKTHNIAIARSIYDYLTKTIDRLAGNATKTEKLKFKTYLEQISAIPDAHIFTEPNWRTWKSSFIAGCSQRLTERLLEQAELMNTEGIPRTSVTGLACRQARSRELDAITLALRSQGIYLSRSRTSSSANITRDGYSAGKKAGDGISLNRQMSNGQGGRYLN